MMDAESADEAIKQIYNIMNKISDNKKTGDGSENASLFKEILGLLAQSQDPRAKRLASQCVGRLFKDFPDEQPAAFEAMMDLLDNDDLAVRKQAISDLPKLCKDVPVYVAKVTDLLVQMLQSDDPQEQPLVNNALTQTLSGHPAEAFTGLFNQLTHEEANDLTRERALRFLTTKLPHLKLTPSQEELLASLLIEEFLYDVSEDEFTAAVQLLAGLGCMRGQKGRQRLVDAVCQQADLTAPFDPASVVDVARLGECARLASIYASRAANAKALLAYYLDKVVPCIEQVNNAASAPGLADSPRLGLMRRLAELSAAAGTSFVATDKQLTAVLALLLDRLPLPPTPPPTPTAGMNDDTVNEADKAPEEGEIAPVADEQGELNFSQIECLLFAFHRLARTNPDFLPACPDRQADFAKRIGYLSQANQVYLRSLRSAARATPPVAMATEPGKESTEADADDASAASAAAATEPPPSPVFADTGRLREIALAVAENIALLARDLSRSPPAYRAELSVACLSWQPSANPVGAVSSTGGGDVDRQRKRREQTVDSDEDLDDYSRRRFAGSQQQQQQRYSDRRNRDRYGGGGGGGYGRVRNRQGGGGAWKRW